MISKNYFSLFLMFSIFLTECDKAPKNNLSNSDKVVRYGMVIHGGAGTILPQNMTAEKETAYRNIIDSILILGKNQLENGANGLDVVEGAIKIMENSPLFNAGKGAVFTHEGKNELDASIMIGQTMEAGAVAGVTTIKNPISAARAVMELSNHVLLYGKGAEAFSKENNLEIVDPQYFFTEKRFQSLQRIISKDSTALDHDEKKGTVGVVVLDIQGNLFAGTSTGGMTNKRWNRIGDSPIIGAGTFADNSTCAVSCTGHGEYFIRHSVAVNVSAQMKFGNKSLKDAAHHMIFEVLNSKEGSGGLIAIDKTGNITMPFNTAGMYRGYVTDKDKFIGIYKEN